MCSGVRVSGVSLRVNPHPRHAEGLRGRFKLESTVTPGYTLIFTLTLYLTHWHNNSRWEEWLRENRCFTAAPAAKNRNRWRILRLKNWCRLLILSFNLLSLHSSQLSRVNKEKPQAGVLPSPHSCFKSGRGSTDRMKTGRQEAAATRPRQKQPVHFPEYCYHHDPGPNCRTCVLFGQTFGQHNFSNI